MVHHPQGVRFSGTLVDNIPDGTWSYTFDDDSQLNRTFVQGVKTKEAELKTSDQKIFRGETIDELQFIDGFSSKNFLITSFQFCFFGFDALNECSIELRVIIKCI